ncbi:MAG: Uma2 family endonuclease [bacterium]
MPEAPRFADSRIADAAPVVIQRGVTSDLYLPRVETNQEQNLIDGFLFASPPPTELHEEIVLTLAEAIDACARKNGGKVFVSRDCRLGDTTVIQADVAFLSLERRNLAGRHLRGAPDLVVEVSSPGTLAFDTEAKFAAYGASGVREAWFVDPQAFTLNVVSGDGARWTGEQLGRWGEPIPSSIVDVGTANLVARTVD